MDFGYSQMINDWHWKYQRKHCLIWQQPAQGPLATVISTRKLYPHPRDKHKPHDPRTDLTDRNVTRVLASMGKSVYGRDYLGIPLGFNIKTAYRSSCQPNEERLTGKEQLPSEPRPKARPSSAAVLTTTTGQTYASPLLLQDTAASLRSSTTRFGSNKKMMAIANGIVPEVIDANYVSSLTQHQTSYQREFRPKTAPCTRKYPDPNECDEIPPKINSYGPIVVNRDEVFQRARTARISPSLAYRCRNNGPPEARQVLHPSVQTITLPPRRPSTAAATSRPEFVSSWPGPL